MFRPANAGASSFYATAMAQFTACRQPWSEYLKVVSKQDTEPYYAPPHEKPMYRGRKRGMEGWLMGEQVQLHYRRYPDEHVISNLTRWRYGQLVDDIAIQQFRNAQPHILTQPDEQGFLNPDPEVYMKLNYKNPGVIGRFLTRTGHFYDRETLPLNPEAILMLRRARRLAYILGLFPKYGNPFWLRSQRDRPQPHRGEYNPVTTSCKATMEHYCYNWLQVFRIRSYFAAAEQGRARQARAATAEERQQDGYDRPRSNHRSIAMPFDAKDVKFSAKKPTVPGLMTTQGLRRNMHLYSESSKRRMGFPNPMSTIKHL